MVWDYSMLKVMEVKEKREFDDVVSFSLSRRLLFEEGKAILDIYTPHFRSTPP